MKTLLIIFMVPGLALCEREFARADDWLQFGGDARRTSHALAAPPALNADLWTVASNNAGETLSFEGQSSPVAYIGRVYANARVLAGTTHVGNKLVAMNYLTGQVLFETPVAAGVQNSWSTPGVDAAHGTILLGSGDRVYSIDAMSGVERWSTPLDRVIVNASVVIADDRSPGRVFITDYDGTGVGGSLYCLNTSDFDAQTNPYAPGEIVWQEAVGGTAGNSPAYWEGIVYVASVTGPISPGFPDMGYLHAFDIDAPPESRRLWSTAAGEGFFGGVAIHNGHVYAASYDFFGGPDNSTLVKFNAIDGTVVWTVPCERTNSTPIVDGDRIFLAAGVTGFGSAPKVEAFQDHGNVATKLWDTYADSAGTLIVGGWTHQPVLGGDVLYCGRIAPSGPFFGAYVEMFMLDVTKSPTDEGFVVDHRIGYGSSPAISNGRIYSIGPDGLHAVAARGDVCSGLNPSVGDGLINGADIQCFLDVLLSPSPAASEVALCDLDGNGQLTVQDSAMLADLLIGE